MRFCYHGPSLGDRSPAQYAGLRSLCGLLPALRTSHPQMLRIGPLRRRGLRRRWIPLLPRVRRLARRHRCISSLCRAGLTVSLRHIGLPVARGRGGRLAAAGNGCLRPSEGCPYPVQPCDVRDGDDCPDHVDVPAGEYRDTDHYEGDLEANSERPGSRRWPSVQDQAYSHAQHRSGDRKNADGRAMSRIRVDQPEQGGERSLHSEERKNGPACASFRGWRHEDSLARGAVLCRGGLAGRQVRRSYFPPGWHAAKELAS